MKIIKDQYPAVRVIAADISLEIKMDSVCGWHSIVLLIDMRGDTFEEWSIEYFDGSGFPPNEKVSIVMEDLAKELRIFRKKLKQTGEVETVIVSGKLRHQTTTTECGTISLIYIRRRLEGISYKMFSTHKIPDNFAKAFRRDIFVV